MSSDPELAALRADADTLCSEPRLRALLHSRWPQLGGARGQHALTTTIHAEDQMLWHSLRHHRDANAAVSQYYNVALQQYQAARQILDLLLPADAGTVSVLDFACGFGRLIRFLSCCERDLQISVSEIQSDALQFVAGTFGVETMPSSMRPEDFDPGRRFDFIWVASLFSHLPEHLFQRWLARLQGLLTPRGVLCFSVHDEALLPQGDTLRPNGLLFKPHSENADLDAEAYGTTYVSEGFVRRAIAAAAGAAEPPVHRIRKGLAHEQDIYVVAADARRDLSALAGFRRGPWGWADERRVEGRTLVLRGWAASIDDGTLPAVDVVINGVTHCCPTGQARPDVRDAFADERLLGAGWQFRLDLPDGAAQPWVEVLAPTAQGECALLYAGWPGGRPVEAAEKVYRRQIDMAERSSLSVLASLVPAGARVLDVGTGTGSLGRILSRDKGCLVDGLTLSMAEHDAARDAYTRLEVLDLEQAGWAGRFAGTRYDCIVCADVLEHLREPEQVLQACHALLAPGGCLLVSVPNAAYAGMVLELMHGEWKYGPEGLLDRTHLRFFTRRSFTRLLEHQGWRTERVEPIDLTWYYTEFWTPFDQVPPAVARYLLAQPDASAYQLVFAARRAGDVQATGPGAQAAADVPKADPAVHVAVFATELIVSDGQGRQQRVAALGRVGEAVQTLRFQIPAQTLQPGAHAPRLVWQVADRPGFIHLHTLSLAAADGTLCWQWKAGDGLACLHQAAHRDIRIGAVSADGLALLLSGSNAHIELPPEALAGLRSHGGPWQLQVSCGWPLSADYRALQQALRAPREGRAESATVEIIVPVYGGLPLLRRCLASVLSAGRQQRWHLTVIDDASPDAETPAWLRELARVHPDDVTVLHNARNLGFVGTVNLGMRLAGRRDVVLLNSDTEVAGDWLERLQGAAHGAPDIGTVTPFSNNATICSFPRFCEANELPPGHDTASLQALFGRLHGSHTVDIPTAVGFCMYIRRDCLDSTGDFDAETFGAGYGEENDFCLRASARGWRHVHALDTFVRHVGGASFSSRQQELQANALAAMRRLHPQYEALVQAYVQHDPARPYREAAASELGLVPAADAAGS